MENFSRGLLRADTSRELSAFCNLDIETCGEGRNVMPTFTCHPSARSFFLPCHLILETGKTLHKLNLLLLSVGERLLDVEQFGLDSLGLLQRETVAVV